MLAPLHVLPLPLSRFTARTSPSLLHCYAMDELPKDFPVPFEEATRTVYRSHNGSLVPAFRLDSILPDYTAATASRAFSGAYYPSAVLEESACRRARPTR